MVLTGNKAKCFSILESGVKNEIVSNQELAE